MLNTVSRITFIMQLLLFYCTFDIIDIKKPLQFGKPCITSTVIGSPVSGQRRNIIMVMIMRMNYSCKLDWGCNIIWIIMCLRHYVWYILTGVKECWRHSQELKPTRYGLTFMPSWPGKSQESSRRWEKRDSTTKTRIFTTPEVHCLKKHNAPLWPEAVYCIYTLKPLVLWQVSGKLKVYGQTSLLNTSAAI